MVPQFCPFKYVYQRKQTNDNSASISHWLGNTVLVLCSMINKSVNLI